MTPIPLSPGRDLLSQGQPAAVHLVGVGGCGMSGLAHLLLDGGWRVSGSDLVVNEEIRQLQARGARIFCGHDAAHLEAGGAALVVHSSAIPTTNPELARARELNLPVVRRATALAALVHRQRGICVAGMHGKTTTSAMLAYTLRELGAPVSFATGWRVPQLSPHARWTKPDQAGPMPFFVIEADESDGSLREFQPECAILLNLDEDHLDYYADFAQIRREFGEFAAQVRGTLVYCADDERLAALLAGRPRAMSYGFHPQATYRIDWKPAEPAGLPGPPRTAFELWHEGRRLGWFPLQLEGGQNVSNAAAVVALLHELAFSPERIAAALAGFRGVLRRQQLLFRDELFAVYDDYGHHPNEIRATLRALRTLRPGRLLVAFQPHRFTRTRDLLGEFAEALSSVDRLWLLEIYSAGEEPLPGVSSMALARKLAARGREAPVAAGPEDLCRSMRAALAPGDMALFLGAGMEVTLAAQELAKLLREEQDCRRRQVGEAVGGLLTEGGAIRLAEPMARHTTFRVGGPVDYYVEPATEQELAALLTFCRQRALPFRVVGRGSNLLVRDGGFRGMIINLGGRGFSGVRVEGQRLICGAGAPLGVVANEARKQGLGGLEFLEGIPGTIGGALRMNAGAMGRWMFQVVEKVRCLDADGRAVEFAAEDMGFEYRGCARLLDHVAVEATLRGEPSSPAAVEATMKQYSARRKATQPRQASAGCVFKNPAEISAGKVIDELGLKGLRVGGAFVSPVHGNFIVNEGSACARDILALMEILREKARVGRGLELEPEVEILGDDQGA